MKVNFLYIVDITDNSILQLGRTIRSDNVPGCRNRHFNQAVQLHSERGEGEKLIDILQSITTIR